jgi:hypothetical protein
MGWVQEQCFLRIYQRLCHSHSVLVIADSNAPSAAAHCTLRRRLGLGCAPLLRTLLALRADVLPRYATCLCTRCVLAAWRTAHVCLFACCRKFLVACFQAFRLHLQVSPAAAPAMPCLFPCKQLVPLGLRLVQRACRVVELVPVPLSGLQRSCVALCKWQNASQSSC